LVFGYTKMLLVKIGGRWFSGTGFVGVRWYRRNALERHKVCIEAGRG
jgi:hypothetical protein